MNLLHQEDKDVLEKVQRKAIGMISGLKTKTYEERCKELGLETLEARRERQDLLETYKIREKQGKTNTGRLLPGNQVRTGAVTRSGADPNNIAVQRTKLDIRKYNFSVRAPETWNKLPSELKASETIKDFKRGLKITPLIQELTVADRMQTVSTKTARGQPQAPTMSPQCSHRLRWSQPIK